MRRFYEAMGIEQAADEIASCFTRGNRLAAMLERRAAQAGADAIEAAKAKRIAERAFPILIWKLDAGEVAPGAEAFAAMSMLIPFGISVSALQRTDIPMALRQALLPVLRPDSRDVMLHWWDEIAVPQWLLPMLRELEADGDSFFRLLASTPAGRLLDIGV